MYECCSGTRDGLSADAGLRRESCRAFLSFLTLEALTPGKLRYIESCGQEDVGLYGVPWGSGLGGAV